jgi:hypothetical protein
VTKDKSRDKTLKVPKRIAGVKVPKKIRKPVNKALAIAENPATRDLAIAALTAAAAALAKKGTDAAASATRRPGERGTDPDRAGRLGDVILAAALDGARRLLDQPPGPSAAPGPASASPSEPRSTPAPKPRSKPAAKPASKTASGNGAAAPKRRNRRVSPGAGGAPDA